MFGWLGKADTADGHTHQLYSNRDGTIDVYKTDALVRGCGTKEASRCESLEDALEAIESQNDTTVTAVRRD
jgi:hypothetical protein